MNEAIDQIIINLKTIGKLKINDKIYINNGFIIIHKESMYRPIVRTLYGYGREQSCILIHEIVQKAIRASTTLLNIDVLNNDNVIFLNYLKIMINLRESFSQCKEGLNNFIRTYVDDVTIVSRIENLIVHINNQLSIIDTKLEKSDFKISIKRHFPQKLEQYITSSFPPSYQTYRTHTNNYSDNGSSESDSKE